MISPMEAPTAGEAGASPKLYARIAGVLYLAVILGGVFAELLVRSRIIVHGDAAATAHNIVAHEMLFRAGFVADLLALMCDIALSVILYRLLRPVNASLSLMAAVLELTGDGILAVLSMGHFAAVLILSGAPYLTVFTEGQLQALALLSLKIHGYGYDLSLVPIACRDVLLGYLIYRSAFLPRIIGVLLALAGLNFLINSLADFLDLVYAPPGFFVIGLFGEGGLCLWLTIVGLNEARWRAWSN